MKVRFSDEARTDLWAIGDFIATDNKPRARSFVKELTDKCAALADMPMAFPLVPRYERHGIRRRAHSNYLIFYRVQPEEIVVIHILHGAMDYAPILFPA